MSDAISGGKVLHLDPSNYVRYVPDQENGETATISIQAWDQYTDGSTYTAVDLDAVVVSTNGGTTPYSSSSKTASITVTDVNDAPVLSTATSSFDSITEDNITNTGHTVAELLDGVIVDVDDSDDTALTGLALYSYDQSNGSWEYSSDESTWFLIRRQHQEEQ